MTLPDTRRLLQTVLAAAAAADPEAHEIAISDWRQGRNQLASRSHAKSRARARRKQLRNTG